MSKWDECSHVTEKVFEFGVNRKLTGIMERHPIQVEEVFNKSYLIIEGITWTMKYRMYGE